MNKVALRRWLTLGGLLAVLLPPGARGVEIKAENPRMGDIVAAMTFQSVPSAKRDELQSAIAAVKKSITDFPLQFGNFRD